MKEYTGRNLAVGDLILFLEKKGSLSDMKYALVISNNKGFDGKKEITISDCYLANMCESELLKKQELMEQYNQKIINDKNKLKSKKKLKNVGDIYMYQNEKGNKKYTIYLGKYNICLNENISESKIQNIYVNIEDDVVFKEFLDKFSSRQCDDEEIISYFLSGQNNLRYYQNKVHLKRYVFYSYNIIMQKSPYLMEGTLLNHIDIRQTDYGMDFVILANIKNLYASKCSTLVSYRLTRV